MDTSDNELQKELDNFNAYLHTIDIDDREEIIQNIRKRIQSKKRLSAYIENPRKVSFIDWMMLFICAADRTRDELLLYARYQFWRRKHKP